MIFPLYTTAAQKGYDGPEELRLFADFLPRIGEFALLFLSVERNVTWAIESFIGATRWDGNELEGMVQNFSSRIKFLDICARPKSRSGAQAEERVAMITRIRTLNAYRNKLIHNSPTGVSYEGENITLRLKRLDKESGKEGTVSIGLSDLQTTIGEIPTLVSDIRRWTLAHCPDAENRVP